MKKILFYVSAAVLMLTAGSCKKDDSKISHVTESDVKLSLELPSNVETKAIAEAESTDIVYYEIWSSDWNRQLYPFNEELASAAVSGKTATIELKLVSDQTYNFIFWAQNTECNAYDVQELKKVGIDYSVIGNNGNQDKFDAFYAIKTIKVEGPVNESIVLTRPFAQLNFGAGEMETTLGDITVSATVVTVSSLATEFNTLTGLGEAPTGAVSFKADGIVTSEMLETNGSSYTWITMDYMLMTGDKANVDIDASFDILGMELPVTHVITNVPLKKNHRTNIVGDLFTTDAVLDVVIDQEFIDDIVCADGNL